MTNQPESAMLQKAVTVLQAQRNQALDALTNSDIRVALLMDEIAGLKSENATLKAENEELKEPAESPKETAEPQ